MSAPPADPLVTIADLRAAGYCPRGILAWCARHGIAWARLRDEGIPAGELIASGDDMAARVAWAVRAAHG